MPTFPILDVAIGLSLIYLLLALSCTTLNEMIAGVLKLRSRNLEKGIGRMLGDPALKSALYTHPLIRSLANASGTSPSYIPSSNRPGALGRYGHEQAKHRFPGCNYSSSEGFFGS